MSVNLDQASVEGSLLSIFFLTFAKFFSVFSYNLASEVLQMTAVSLTIIVTVDTLFGSPLKSFLTKKFKKNGTHNKSR